MSAESIPPSSTDSAPQRNSNNLPAVAATCTGIDSSTSPLQFRMPQLWVPNQHNQWLRQSFKRSGAEWRIVLLCRKCARLVDSELAIQLHRSLNSSHRVLRNSSSLSSCSLSIQETMLRQGTLSVKASSKFRGDEEKTCSNKVINSSSDDNDTGTEYQSCHLPTEMRQSKPRTYQKEFKFQNE